MLFLAVTSVFVAAAAALPSTPFAYPEGVTVTEYPNGLPEELKPSSEGSALEKRGNAGVYACNERNFGGFCVHLVVQEYTCVNLGPDSNDKISSVGPDSPKYCLFYSNFNCNDNEGHFGTFSPGYSDLSSAGPPGPYWNDRISSFVCHPN